MSENTQNTTNPPATKQNLTKMGALWSRENERGSYQTGQIEIAGKTINILVLPNTFKTDQKHPDWKIFYASKQAPGVVIPNALVKQSTVVKPKVATPVNSNISRGTVTVPQEAEVDENVAF